MFCACWMLEITGYLIFDAAFIIHSPAEVMEGGRLPKCVILSVYLHIHNNVQANQSLYSNSQHFVTHLHKTI